MTTARRATPKTLPHRTVLGALAVCLMAAALQGAGVAQAQTGGAAAAAEEVMDTAQTPAGELSLVRRREADGVVVVLIKLGGRVLAEKGASREGDAYQGASFAGLYPQSAPRYALVGFSTGALVCGAKFTIVDLSRGAAGARATEDFGNCSDAPRVAYRRGALTVTFPAGSGKRDPGSHYVGPGQVWSYGGGRLRKVGRRR